MEGEKQEGIAPAPEVAVTQAAAPPSEAIEVGIATIESYLTAMPMPEYVKESGEEFIAALRKWAAEGK